MGKQREEVDEVKIIEEDEEVVQEAQNEGAQDEEIESGVISESEAREPYTREKETGKKFKVKHPLKPERFVDSPEYRETGEDGVAYTNDSMQTGNRQQKSGKTELISVNTYIKCYIGKTWYEFVPGRTYRVPANVKERLKARNVLEVL